VADDHGKDAGRRGEIEDAVAAGLPLGFELAKHAAEALVGAGIVEVAA
jgi:hypothetical protein